MVIEAIGVRPSFKATKTEKTKKDESKQDKSQLSAKKPGSSVMTKVGQYSGVAALALSAYAVWKIKGMSDAQSKFLKESVEKSATAAKEAVEKGAKATKEALEKNAKTAQEAISSAEAKGRKSSNEIWGVIGTLTGATGAAKIAAGSDENGEEKEVTDEDKKEIKKSAKYYNHALGIPERLKLQGEDIKLSEAAQKEADKIPATIEKYMNVKPGKSEFPIEKGDTVWSVTAEFKPMATGGLGAVPVDLQTNFEKLGIHTPTFVPMYVKSKTEKDKNGNPAGEGVFTPDANDKNKATYKYKKDSFDLVKLADFNISVDRDSKVKKAKTEAFLAVKKNGKDIKPLVLFKNDDYFAGTGIYSDTYTTPEVAKFAFFSKAIYEFAKAKVDAASVPSLKVADKAAYDSIKAPNKMILNDWHTAPVAALMRLKAPLEQADGKLNYKDHPIKTNGDKKLLLPDTELISIGHNVRYQGAKGDKHDIQYILNTLFDNYTSTIVQKAVINQNDYNHKNKDASNVTLFAPYSKDRHLNMLNYGVALSNYFAPVSKNYAKELIKDKNQSTCLNWIITQKNSVGRVNGVINGYDLETIGMNDMLKNPNLNKDFGCKFEGYDASTPIDKVMNARLHNKTEFYNKFVKGMHEGSAEQSGLEFTMKEKGLPFETMDEKTAKETPVLGFFGRLVSQKGVDITANAVEKIFADWETKHPGKPKPIVYIGGKDGEGGKQRKFVDDLKTRLSDEDSQRVIFLHGFAPKEIQACSDYFLIPSRFEPCGLVQMESFAKGTPVIAANTGGIPDTVNRDKKHPDGIIADNKGEITPNDLKAAIEKGLDIFFDKPETYKDMVKASIKEDFSWIQPDKKGPIFEYLELFGADKSKFEDLKK